MIPDLADLQSVSKNKNKARIINPRYHKKKTCLTAGFYII